MEDSSGTKHVHYPPPHPFHHKKNSLPLTGSLPPYPRRALSSLKLWPYRCYTRVRYIWLISLCITQKHYSNGVWTSRRIAIDDQGWTFISGKNGEPIRFDPRVLDENQSGRTGVWSRPPTGDARAARVRRVLRARNTPTRARRSLVTRTWWTRPWTSCWISCRWSDWSSRTRIPATGTPRSRGRAPGSRLSGRPRTGCSAKRTATSTARTWRTPRPALCWPFVRFSRRWRPRGSGASVCWPEICKHR